MTVDGHPEVEHDALPGQLQRPRLDVFRSERPDENSQVDGRDAVESRKLPRRNVLVDRKLHQVRLRQLRTRTGHDCDERNDDLTPVWA